MRRASIAGVGALLLIAPPAFAENRTVELFGGTSASSIFVTSSANGGRLFFDTFEDIAGAGGGDGDAARDIYMAGPGVGQRTLITPGTATSNVTLRGVSADGTRAFFTSDDPPGNDPPTGDVDAWRWENGTFTQVSTPAAGFTIQIRAVKADGTAILYSESANESGTDLDGAEDIYRWQNGTITLMTPNTVQTTSFEAATPDLTKVFFRTNEDIAGEGDGTNTDLYRADGSGTNLHVTPGTPAGNQAMIGVSDDGTKAFFFSSENLAGDADGAANDMFRWDEGTGMLTLVSGTAPAQVNLGRVSADGSRAFFLANTDPNTGAIDDGFADDLYRWDSGMAGHTWLTPGTPEAVQGNYRITSDGNRVVFPTSGAVAGVPGGQAGLTDLYRVESGTTTLLTTPSNGASETLAGASDDLLTVFFRTPTSLTAADTDAASQDIYRVLGGNLKLISDSGPSAAALDASTVGVGSSPDGTVFVFSTTEGYPGNRRY